MRLDLHSHAPRSLCAWLVVRLLSDAVRNGSAEGPRGRAGSPHGAVPRGSRSGEHRSEELGLLRFLVCCYTAMRLDEEEGQEEGEGPDAETTAGLLMVSNRAGAFHRTPACTDGPDALASPSALTIGKRYYLEPHGARAVRTGERSLLLIHQDREPLEIEFEAEGDNTSPRDSWQLLPRALKPEPEPEPERELQLEHVHLGLEEKLAEFLCEVPVGSAVGSHSTSPRGFDATEILIFAREAGLHEVSAEEIYRQYVQKKIDEAEPARPLEQQLAESPGAQPCAAVVAALEQRVAELQTCATAAAARANDEIKTLQRRLGEAEMLAEETAERCRGAEAALLATEQGHAAVTAELEAQIRTMHTAQTSLEAQAAEVEPRLRAVQARAAAAEDKAARLQQQLSTHLLAKSVITAKKETREALEQLEGTEREKAGLQEQLAKSQAEVAELRARMTPG